MLCSHLKEGETPCFKLVRFEVNRDQSLFTMMSVQGMSGRYVPEGSYIKLVEKRLSGGDVLWMSDTPAEQRDHYTPYLEIRNRGGSVLIFGLGLGMIAHAALKLPNVDNVVVVEREQEVIDLIEPQIRHPKLHVICTDANTLKPSDLVPILGEGYHLSVFYADIWPDLCTDNLKEYGNMKRRWSKVSDFRWCWGEDTLRREQRKSRESYRWF
jgi:hypothetical protein